MKTCLTKGKVVALVLAVALLLMVCGSTVAYLVTGTDPLELIFTPATVECELDYTLSVDAASDYYIKNTGTAPVYIRATVLVQWVRDDDGVTVLAIPPEKDSDYSIEYAPTEQTTDDNGYVTSSVLTKWKFNNADGYWYYTEPVDPGKQTMKLIGSFKRLNSMAPNGYTLRVEVLAQAIQTNAAKNAWGIDPESLKNN